MKKTLFVGGLAALTLATAGGVAIAQQTPARPAPALRADTDGDNRISQAEFVARRMQRLTAADADRDGSVTHEEMRATAQARRAERGAARFDRLDADKDGSISRAEFDAHHGARAQARDGRGGMRGGHGGGRGHGPGGAGAGAMGAGGPVVIAQARANAEQAFARMDANSDGYVTADERRAGRMTMREHRRGRMAGHHAAPQASPPAPASE